MYSMYTRQMEEICEKNEEVHKKGCISSFFLCIITLTQKRDNYFKQKQGQLNCESCIDGKRKEKEYDIKPNTSDNNRWIEEYYEN